MSEFNPDDFYRAHRPPLVDSQIASGILFPRFKRWNRCAKMSMPPVLYVDYFLTHDADYPCIVDLYVFFPYDDSPVFTHDYICSMLPDEFLSLYHDCKELFPKVRFVVEFNDVDIDMLNSAPEFREDLPLFDEN